MIIINYYSQLCYMNMGFSCITLTFKVIFIRRQNSINPTKVSINDTIFQ